MDDESRSEGTAGDDADDPLRRQLIDAASQVFAEKGYAGTKIKDIVRVAGLSSGALYGRFDSKEDLLTEAVLSQSKRVASAAAVVEHQITDLIADIASRQEGPLGDAEAMQVELYVTARRIPEVAVALKEARARQREAITPLLRNAKKQGIMPAGHDVDSMLFFFDTVYLGLLLQRSAGFSPPDAKRWRRFVEDLLAGIITTEE